MKCGKSKIEYLGLETFFQNIINANEKYSGGCWDCTKSTDITRRIPTGLEIFDGAYDVYVLGEMAISSLRCYNGRYYFYGYILNRQIEEIDLNEKPDISVDITDFAEDYNVDIDRLLLKIHKTILRIKNNNYL